MSHVSAQRHERGGPKSDSEDDSVLLILLNVTVIAGQILSEHVAVKQVEDEMFRL